MDVTSREKKKSDMQAI